jgi:CHAT domain-containing protein
LHHAVRADISEALREHRPHVLHLIGHGTFEDGRGKLIVEDEDHYALEMSDRAFRELLEGHPETRLVVLNACQGATRAAGDAMVGMGPQLVGRGVPAVVAMQYPVYDRAAINFTREFYRALAHWYPIDVALSQARRAIYLDFGLDRRDWGVPVLFMRDRHGLLFVPPEKKEKETTPEVDVSIEAKEESQIAIGGDFQVSGRDSIKTNGNS